MEIFLDGANETFQIVEQAQTRESAIRGVFDVTEAQLKHEIKMDPWRNTANLSSCISPGLIEQAAKLLLVAAVFSPADFD